MSEQHRTRIDAKLDSLHEKVDTLIDLLPRLSALELWRANLNGRAEEVARRAGYDTPHHRAGEYEDHVHQRTVDAVLAVLAAKQAEAFDVGKWLRVNWKPVTIGTLVVIFLAAVSGETLRLMLEPAMKSVTKDAITMMAPMRGGGEK